MMLLKNVRTEQSLWLLMDALVVAALVGILGALALRDHRDTIAHFRTTEALFLLTEAKASAQEFRAVHGRWPEIDEHVASTTSVRKDGDIGSHTRNVTYGGEGLLTFTFKENVTRGRGRMLSMRGTTASMNGRSAVVWVCGYSAPPPGFAATRRDATDIHPALLPAACRNKNKGTQ